MKILLGWCVTVAVSLLLCGCFVQALNPLFSDSELVSFPALAGTWKQDKTTWTFIPDGNRYKLTHVDEDNRPAVFRASVGKLGTNYFMDLFLDDPKVEMNQVALLHMVSAHVVLRMEKEGPDLSLAPIDLEWLQKALKQNPKLVPHVMQEDRPVLTATTAELQRFVSEHAADTNVFKNSLSLKRAQ